ncbi:MAG: BMP family ABC transporter substrate-binding protein [Thermobacillus sp. ZCTH02-B1]|uniref:BMP family lipoprotein n=1 Tax=Thermobacillus sp. ZCTH02-B1 TaxID=1858795 RepID=UPI000B57F290|nr:BMP family protein [Thermobacillus sp. ZCTH02-B1]OUM94389.1 MAG: BMP family ABC transporter substrate-binding protein [Thermobacillus sp. ZCTH02-B1]
MKRTSMLVLMAVLIVSLLAACGGGNNGKGGAAGTSGSEGTNAGADADAGGGAEGPKKRIALVLPEKIGVNAFFTQMVDGLNQAAEDFGVEVKTIESTDPAALEQNLRAAVADGYDLIITSSFTAVDALTKVAAENPDRPFAIIDQAFDAPNVRSIEFREHEAAFLLGAAAGLVTKTNTVGAVVAMDIPLLGKYTSGFEQGLRYTNPDANFLVSYVGSFTDPAKAKELALVQYEQGADFIAGMSAVSDNGIFEAAKEKGFLTSGQDVDRTVEDPEHIILSQLKETDTVVYETVKDFAQGRFTFGTVHYGLAENGVGLTFVTAESPSPVPGVLGQEKIEQLKKIRDDIVSGVITVVNPLEQQ